MTLDEYAKQKPGEVGPDEPAPKPKLAGPVGPEDLDNLFTHHPPKGCQPERYEAIRAEAKKFATVMMALCPPSRELSLAMTKLREATFWANASIACNE